MTDLTGAAEPSAEPPRRRFRSKSRTAESHRATLAGFRRGLALILVPSLLLVAIEVFNAIRLVPQLRQSQALVAHTFEVMRAARTLDMALQDAERGQRGFLITGDDAYLAPYRTGIEQAPLKLRELRQLTADNPEQQHRIDFIETQMATKLAELKQTISVRRSEGFDAARRIVETSVGMDTMRAIVTEIARVIATEDRLLDARQAGYLRASRVSAMTGVVAAALASIVILLGGLLLARAYRRTERSQSSLERSEERFRLLVSGVRDYAIFMLDPAGNVVSWNEGAQRIKGYRADEIVGSHFSRFFPAEEAAKGTPQGLLEAAAAADSVEAEGWRVRKDGSRFWANVVITALRAPDGGLRGFAKVVRDITERRQQQQDLEHNREVLAQYQKMEAIGQLTGGVAHDFNNLLQTILGSIELLQRPGGSGDAARAARLLDAARRAAEHGAALTQRLLAFSRRQALAPQIIDANKLVGGMSELLHRTLGETIAIETVLAAGLWRVYVDPNQLENAILNLAVNARDAMPSGGKLTIETGNTWLDDDYAATHAEVTPGQYALVAISDSGEGMSEEVIERAFEPFFTTKPAGKGTGLGLAQVHGFVKQSGGHINLYSEPGHGTTINIYLPRHAAQGEAEPAADRTTTAGAAQGESVLLVEDDDNVRLYGVEALKTLGYAVFEASESGAALRILEQRPEIAVLFTDVGLPGVNGRKLAEAAKSRAPNLKVLYTTGYARNAIVHNGILDTGVDLLAKPFTVEALGRKLQQMLHGR